MSHFQFTFDIARMSEYMVWDEPANTPGKNWSGTSGK